MKMTKKKIFAISLAVCAIAILSAGTLAWFSDVDEGVENRFMIATSTETDPEKVFSIDLYEMEDTDGNGIADTRTDSGITFDGQEVAPGAVLPKEVYVDNTGKFDQYARVIVTLTDVAAWMDVLGINTPDDYVKLDEIFLVDADFDTKWYRNDADTNHDTAADTLTYVYYYNGVLGADAADPAVKFMNGVKIPSALEREDVIELAGEFNLNIKAEAVQAVNMLDPYGTVEYENAIKSFDIAF